ncbi:MAG: hypothetical protein RR288_01355 [Oscillibacter sp.]
MNALMNASQNTARYASANCAEASCACMKRASNNSIITILDAAIVASIIICALVSVLVLGASLLILVLLAVLLIIVFLHKPKKRTTD